MSPISKTYRKNNIVIEIILPKKLFDQRVLIFRKNIHRETRCNWITNRKLIHATKHNDTIQHFSRI